MSRPVFLAPAEDLAAATPGTVMTIGGAEAHHALRAQRLRQGDEIDLVDGAGTRARVTITHTAGEKLSGDVLATTIEAPNRPRLVLVQALAKGGRDERGVEMATEAGIDAIIPWQAQRCVARWEAERAAKGVARWASLTESAGKQARRAHHPIVEQLRVGTNLAQHVGAVCEHGGAALLLHEEAETAAAQAWLPASGGDVSVLLVVGPEGGMSPAETAALQRAGGQLVHLGPHVLRSGTAGVVATTLTAHRLGRLQRNVA